MNFQNTFLFGERQQKSVRSSGSHDIAHYRSGRGKGPAFSSGDAGSYGSKVSESLLWQTASTGSEPCSTVVVAVAAVSQRDSLVRALRLSGICAPSRCVADHHTAGTLAEHTKKPVLLQRAPKSLHPVDVGPSSFSSQRRAISPTTSTGSPGWTSPKSLSSADTQESILRNVSFKLSEEPSKSATASQSFLSTLSSSSSLASLRNDRNGAISRAEDISTRISYAGKQNVELELQVAHYLKMANKPDINFLDKIKIADKVKQIRTRQAVHWRSASYVVTDLHMYIYYYCTFFDDVSESDAVDLVSTADRTKSLLCQSLGLLP
jgi:hypothetical protein